MNRSTSPARPAHWVSLARRAELLQAFERSGMSAAAFARQYHLNYTTFCGWRHRAEHRRSPGFVQVELPGPSAPTPPAEMELVIELGARCRMRVSAGQLGLAAQLLKELHGDAPC